MQNLNKISKLGDNYPYPSIIIEDTDTDFLIAYDFVYLRKLHEHMNDTSLRAHDRQKYLAAWHMIELRHPHLLRTLVAAGFDPTSIVTFDWSEAMARVGTDRGFHG